jgi:hypothetical protein
MFYKTLFTKAGSKLGKICTTLTNLSLVKILSASSDNMAYHTQTALDLLPLKPRISA